MRGKKNPPLDLTPVPDGTPLTFDTMKEGCSYVVTKISDCCMRRLGHIGSKVGFPATISGTVSGLSTQQRVHVLVKPLKDPNFYVQNRPSNTIGGKWRTLFYCGTKEGGGVGEDFEIFAIVTTQVLVEHQALKEIPNDAAKSGLVQVVAVTRAK